MQDRNRPLLALTMGDPAGIGPEVVLKALRNPEVYAKCRPLVVGDLGTLERDLALAGLEDGRTLSLRRVDSPKDGAYEHGSVDVIQIRPELGPIAYGRVSKDAGRAAVASVRTAAQLASEKAVDGLVTAPLNKEAMHRGGYLYPGHTELLAEYFGVDDFSLVLNAQRLYVFHVTTHMALREACDSITAPRVQKIIELAHRFCLALGRDGEEIAVVGLNPHAGENGLFGHEDTTHVAPAIAAAQAKGINVRGPLPGDTLFPQAIKGRYSFVIAMYHDQGHLPFKSVYFDEGVNITVGLPIVRTSVDHGTAFDIAGRGLASEESMLTALDVAVRLAPQWSDIWHVVGAD